MAGYSRKVEFKCDLGYIVRPCLKPKGNPKKLCDLVTFDMKVE